MIKRIFLKILLAAVLAGASATSASAQEMKDLFVAMPDSCAPQLESAWRKDLVDLFLSGKTARLQNTMNGYTSLSALTDDYLCLQLTGRSRIELKRLPLVNHTYIICMVTTVYGPAPDSRVQFFTTGWQPLDGGRLLPRLPKDWYLKQPVDTASSAYQEARARLDMDLVRYDLSPDKQTLTATYTTPLYLNADEQKEIAPALAAPKVYTWNKSAFE
ncbi:MAG: DUF3256 family protein [Tannerella sp.]|jgi:hypothetical protein|nr:DUF3256 family protein [Tannerella sp.]